MSYKEIKLGTTTIINVAGNGFRKFESMYFK